MNFNFAGTKALVRVDFNVPIDKKTLAITDDTRMRAALPTINKILNDGGSVILMSHFDRPLTKLKEDGSIDVKRFTLQNLQSHLADLLQHPVLFISDCLSEGAKQAAHNLKAGEVLLLENTRFYAGEEKGDVNMAAQLSSYGDVYVNDAFGSAHRAHASTATVAQFFPKEKRMFGYLMEAEVLNGQKVLNNPEKPFTAIIGGAKVSDKILIIKHLINRVDNLIIGGGMAYTFFKALGGNIGKSLCEKDRLDEARNIVAQAMKNGVRLLLPFDSVVADAFKGDAKTEISESDAINTEGMALDIGPKAAEFARTILLNSKTILWNGPMGVFEMEAFANGTKKVALAVVDATKNGAYSLVGGGDSVAALNALNLEHEVSYVSTGGGAMLEFLEGKTLPGIAAISE